jgi:hypothetical protein
MADIERGTPEQPVYRKVRHWPDSALCLIEVDEGWRSTVVASGMYEHVADWLVGQIQGKPMPEPCPGGTRQMSDEEIEQLARDTMAAFWATNNLEQKLEVLRAALRQAAGHG